MHGYSMAISRICTFCTVWASSNTELATALLHVEMWKLLPLHHHVYSLFVSRQLRHTTGDRVTNVGQNFVAYAREKHYYLNKYSNFAISNVIFCHSKAALVYLCNKKFRFISTLTKGSIVHADLALAEVARSTGLAHYV